MSSRNDKNITEAPSSTGPVAAPNRRASFSQNPSFSTLFGRSPPRASVPDPNLQRRFSWSFPPPKESSSAIDDSDDMPTSPSDGGSRRDSDIGIFGRRLSTTATSLREALGMGKPDEPPSPGQMKAVSLPFYHPLSSDCARYSPTLSVTICADYQSPFQQKKPGEVPTSPHASEGTRSSVRRRTDGYTGGSFIQRRRASFGKPRREADPHADRMLQGHFSID